LSKQSPLERTREVSEHWCKAQAISTQEAIKEVTGQSYYLPIREKFNQIFSVSDQIARNCNIRMGGAANLDLLYYLSEHVKARNALETGVSYGWSSLAILLSISTRNYSLLTSTDMPYPIKDSDKYLGCVVPENLKSYWKIIKLADRDGIPLALSNLKVIDICHYDSNKSYKERQWAYPLLWNALRQGGCFISDDIGDNVAFHDFCHALKLEPLVIETPRRNPKLKKYTGLLIKPN
jgi:hypothetical protein